MGISEALRWIASAFVLPNRQMAKQPWQSSMNSVRSRNLATIWAQEQAAVLSSFPPVSTDQVDLSSHPPSLLFCLSRLKVQDFTPNSLRLRTLSAQSLMLRSTSHVRQGTGFFQIWPQHPALYGRGKKSGSSYLAGLSCHQELLNDFIHMTFPKANWALNHSLLAKSGAIWPVRYKMQGYILDLDLKLLPSRKSIF